MKTITLVLTGLFCTTMLSLAGAKEPNGSDNWHQWRGPEGTGTAASAADLPVKWSERENVRWKVAIPGRGHASPIVWEDRVFLLTAIPADEADIKAARTEPKRGGFFGRTMKPKSAHKFDVLCIHRKSGKILWRRTANEQVPHEGHFRRRGSFASGSPVTDGKHLYAHFGSWGTYCYDLDGNLVWKRDLGKKRMRHGFGDGSSPALYEDTLILNLDQEGQSKIVVLDKNTGKTLWSKDRDEPSSWATPVVVVHDGKPQAVLPATKAIRSYDLRSGEEVWQCKWESGNVVSTPVFGHGMTILTTGHKKYALRAVRLDAVGDITDSAAVTWSLKRSTPYVPSPLLVGTELYLLRDKGFLSCYDAKTGTPHYELQRLPGNFSASPVAGDGKIYLAAEDGQVVVVQAGPEFKILATNEMNETFFASPAIAGNDIILRSDTHLYRISKG